MTKPYLNYSQQIDNLTINKGLIITDPVMAQQKLTDIGYFALIGGYKTPFVNPMTRKYISHTTFEDILALYIFDKELRLLTFEYLADIKQKIRQLISDSFCYHFGEQQSCYLSAANYNNNPKSAQSVSKLIYILDKLANKNSDHAYIVHQRKTYNNVPLWVLTKALTFGQLSKMYSLLRSNEQSYIGKAYKNITEKDLTRYLNALTFFRNVCAHNERLYSHRLIQQDFPDKPLHKKLAIPKKGNQYIQGKNDYFGLVISFRYLLPEDAFLLYKRQLKKLISSYTKSSNRLSKEELLDQMGMPSNWESITRYKL